MTDILNIVVPMAGHGSRFRDAGYDLPKPLILVHGKPMIEVVIGNVRPRRPHRFVFLCLAEHLEKFGLKARLEHMAPGCAVVPVPGVTEGAACTVLLARSIIDTASPLMMANSDQFVETDINEYLGAMDRSGSEGFIMTMKADHPQWSYLGFDASGRISRVVEKEVVSNEATVGVYNFAHGKDFVHGADSMISKNIRVNNEFYVAPVYNELIAEGKRIDFFNIGEVGHGMHGLGTPLDLEAFLKHPVSRRFS